MRLIQSLNHGGHAVKIYRDAEFNEYRVRVYPNGQLHAAADYFTADKADAIDSAPVMLRQLVKSSGAHLKTYADYVAHTSGEMRREPAILPNGREVHVIKYGFHIDRGVVLAYQGEHDAMPWVTWEFYRGDLASTSDGHYFKTLEKAREDFVKRVDNMREDDYGAMRPMCIAR
jgi:hypothetical protein